MLHSNERSPSGSTERSFENIAIFRLTGSRGCAQTGSFPFEGNLRSRALPSHSGPCSAAEEDWMFMLHPTGDLFPCCGNLQDQGADRQCFRNAFQGDLVRIARNQGFSEERAQWPCRGVRPLQDFRASSADPSHEMSYLARRLTSQSGCRDGFRVGPPQTRSPENSGNGGNERLEERDGRHLNQ